MEKYLNVCMDSIINQTYKNLEIILVDDGSKDRSPQICDEYVALDNRVKVIHKANGGQGSARNMALDIAKGEYISFVDSDDWIELDMYEYLLDISQKEDADIVVCETTHIYENGEKKAKNRYPGILLMDKQAAMINTLNDSSICSASPCNKLYKSALFENLRYPLNRLLEDSALMYRLIDISEKVVYTNISKYNIRCNMASVSRSSYNAKRTDTIITYEEMEAFLKSKAEYKDLVHYATSSKIGAIFYNMGELHSSQLANKKEVQAQIIEKCKKILNEKNYITAKQKLLLYVIIKCPTLYGLIYKLIK
jgi:glycosyltransferase involved in cell wall biosynthesis